MTVRRLLLCVVALAQAGAAVAPAANDPKFRYVLPAGFRGWACTDFGVAEAPALEQDARGFYLIRPIADVILKTSSLPGFTHGASPTELVEIIDGQPRSIDRQRSSERLEYSTTGPIWRSCLLFGADDARSVRRPPTLRESRMGTSPILDEFEFEQGSLCDFKQVTSLCIDAKDVRKGSIGRTIASAVGMPATLKSSCDGYDRVAVRYRGEWGVATHSPKRVDPKPFAEIRRSHRINGSIVLAVWMAPEEESAEAGARRFAGDLVELFRKASAASCGK